MTFLVLLAGLASAEISLEEAPVTGERTYVIVTDAEGRPRGGETVRVIHRPGLSGESETAIGITDALGRAEWKPEHSGVARLIAGEEELALHVAWPAAPMNALVLLFLLLVAGVGASAYGVAGRPPRKA